MILGMDLFHMHLNIFCLASISHEELSLAFMDKINWEFGGELDLAISMFTGNYKRKFFHDLISSQIDMDRLDYLVRDSFYTGVIEGSVGAGQDN